MSHIYHPAPAPKDPKASTSLTKGTIASAAIKTDPADDEMDSNPLYNDPTPVTDLTFSFNAEYATPPLAHASLGGAELNGSAIYAQVLPRDQVKLVSANAVSQNGNMNMQVNVAYGDPRSPSSIQNPLYVTSASDTLPPIYNVPKPALKSRRSSGDGYAPLTNMPDLTLDLPPSSLVPPPDQQPRYESIELATKDISLKGKETATPEQDTKLDSDQHYAVPAPSCSQESESTRYGKLRHSPGGARTVRLAAIPDSGYETLPTE